MEKILCTIQRTIFYNEENGYSVLLVKEDSKPSPFALIGNFLEMQEGIELSCEGEWIQSPKYGLEFQCSYWEESLPATTKGIENYLSSGLIKGIGPKTARLIVSHFREKTLDILENHLFRLLEIPSIGHKRLQTIREGWNKHKEIKDVMIFLQGHGVSAAYAIKIFRRFGQDSINIIKDNPYCLADEVDGIGFLTADTIARKLGYSVNDERRLVAGIKYTLNRLALNGHCYSNDMQLMDSATQLLEADPIALGEALLHVIDNKIVINDHGAIYLPEYWKAEVNVSRKLASLVDYKGRSRSRLKSINVAKLEKKTGTHYNECQLDAINLSLSSQVMVLTGGPGTGKTTTLKAMIAALKSANYTIALAAPTGRAAKRMSEATGMEAKTIHRLLEYSPKTGYQRNEQNPISQDVLIIDECSMIDIHLMNHLMRAVRPSMKLVLVGDIDQLPSVGAGNVLRDIIDSQKVPVVRLIEIFRQSKESYIISNAHAINQGRFPNISNGKQSDFFFIQENDPNRAADLIISLVHSRLPKAYQLKPSDIQVLTPMKKGALGTVNLNVKLQEALNTHLKHIKKGNSQYRLGDRVMQIRNNYDKEVFNGDLGYISAIDEDENEIEVNFDNHIVKYEYSDMDELTLAYATTIHKSQGSEYPVVVIPVSMAHYIMLQRNLIYTGVTRTKKLCVLVGETKALEYAIKNLVFMHRNTKLKERIETELDKLEEKTATAV